MTDFSSDLSDSSSSDESLPDMAKLAPYDHEPVCKPRKLADSLKGLANSLNVPDECVISREGNLDWCQCGKCEVMETDAESICCQDTTEVPEDLYEGIIALNKILNKTQIIP